MNLKKYFELDNLKERDEKRRKGGRFNRMGAYIIDHFIQVVVENILILVVWMIVYFMGLVPGGTDINIAVLPQAIQIPTILAIIGIAVFYQIFFPLYIHEGQTYGKRLIGLKIVKLDDTKAGLLNYVLRFLGMILEGFPFVSFTGAVMYLLYFQYLGESLSITIGQSMGFIFAASVIYALFQKERRSFHDLLAGTKVIPVDSVDLTDYSRVRKDIDISNI
jgi:uncharacterized RDD family membrane protein YckC